MRKLIVSLLLGCTALANAYTPHHNPTYRVIRPLKLFQPMANSTQAPSSHHPTTLTATKRMRYSFYPGSLRTNITKLAHEFGWTQVVWEPRYDYHWVGTTQFSQTNLKDILKQVLQNFPLQAVFFEGNHILVITPRNLQ